MLITSLTVCYINSIFILFGGPYSMHLRPLQNRIFTTCMAQVFKAGTPPDEEKEGSLWRIRLRPFGSSVREYPGAHLPYLGQLSPQGEL